MKRHIAAKVGTVGGDLPQIVISPISFIPDRPTNLSYVPTFKKVGI